MARRLYPAVLERGPKGTFVVWLPDFADCVAGGLSREEAVEKAELLLAQAADAMAEREAALPEPTPLERVVVPKRSKFVAFFLVGVEPPDPSERVNIYLPKSLIARADARAGELGMSRSSFFGLAVTTLIGWRASGMSIMEIEKPRSKVRASRQARAGKAGGRGK
jgi:predicted RNase H-like HicB family nuclease